MMQCKGLEDWAPQVRELLAELESQDFGYPLGVNEVRQAASAAPIVVPELAPLYAVSDGVSLPDVHVGYFIDTADRASSAAERGEPIRVEGAKPANIWVFGSDGGGGRFAISRDDGSVYYLPASGVVRNGTFYEDAAVTSKRVAETLAQFLWRLHGDVAAFVYNKECHEYLAQ